MIKGKHITKKALIFLCIMVMITSLSVTAFAVSDGADSPFSYATAYDGIDYRFNSSIWVNPNTIGFQAYIQNVDYGDIPVGHVGVNARLFSTSEVMVKDTDFGYNTTTQSFLLAVGNYSPSNVNSLYQSRGEIKLYNGNRYTIIPCNGTPYYSLSSTKQNESEISIQRNANGEIYGAAPSLEQLGIEPDLILAQGVDGTIGYVRSTDLDDHVTTPEEAIKAMENRSPKTVPLYESDGETIIGEFEISVGEIFPQ